MHDTHQHLKIKMPHWSDGGWSVSKLFAMSQWPFFAWPWPYGTNYLKPYFPLKSWKQRESPSFTHKLCTILPSNPWLFPKKENLLLSIGIINSLFYIEVFTFVSHKCKQTSVYITLRGPTYRTFQTINSAQTDKNVVICQSIKQWFYTNVQHETFFDNVEIIMR